MTKRKCLVVVECRKDKQSCALWWYFYRTTFLHQQVFDWVRKPRKTYSIEILRNSLKLLRISLVPTTTQHNGSSAMHTGSPVSSRIRLSRFFSKAPPPASTMPRSMMSAEKLHHAGINHERLPRTWRGAATIEQEPDG